MSDDDLEFKNPFSCIVSRLNGSGKSSFCIRLLQNFDAICTERQIVGGIIWCYSEKTAVPERQLLPSNTAYHEGVPEIFGGGGGDAKPCLVILDDLLNDVYSKEVWYLFTIGSHHRYISVILITPNLFHQGRNCRDRSLNGHYLVGFKNVRVHVLGPTSVSLR